MNPLLKIQEFVNFIKSNPYYKVVNNKNFQTDLPTFKTFDFLNMIETKIENYETIEKELGLNACLMYLNQRRDGQHPILLQLLHPGQHRRPNDVQGIPQADDEGVGV